MPSKSLADLLREKLEEEAAVTVKYARVDARADADNVVVAPVPGKKIRVLSYGLTNSAAATYLVKGSGGGVLAEFVSAANARISFNGSFDVPAFETPAGEGLVINNPVGNDVLGHLSYIEA